MRMTGTWALLCLAIVALAAGASAAGEASGRNAQVGSTDAPKIEALGWIAGVWEMERGEARTEERWTDLGGDTYMAISRTIRAGHTVFYEYLRIEQRGDGIYYVAQPKNRLPVDFKLVRLDRNEAVFENLNHDFPQRIVYRRNDDGTLTARIEGPRQGQTVSQEFHFRPAGPPAP